MDFIEMVYNRLWNLFHTEQLFGGYDTMKETIPKEEIVE